jgi:hypothetical protein
LLTDEGYFDIFPAMGAIQNDRNRLLHDAFGNGSENRIDIIQSVVQQLQSLFQSVKIRSVVTRSYFIFSCQDLHLYSGNYYASDVL